MTVGKNRGFHLKFEINDKDIRFLFIDNRGNRAETFTA